MMNMASGVQSQLSSPAFLEREVLEEDAELLAGQLRVLPREGGLPGGRAADPLEVDGRVEVRGSEGRPGRDAHARRQGPHALLQLVVGLGGALDGHLRVELRAKLHLEPELIGRRSCSRASSRAARQRRRPAIPCQQEKRFDSVYHPAVAGTFLGRKLMNMDRRRE
jgi:hypothetical protein